MVTAPYLQVEQATKYFGKSPALQQVSLTIGRGEFLCLLGPSGCGKTTLLRIIAGLETLNQGRIIQNSQDITRFPPSRRDFGIVFQSYALFPNLTAAQNVAFGLQNKRFSRNTVRERVQEWLILVGLEGHGHKFPAQLSGGQQQRVALARALALSPGLLLLDEPLSALDAQVRNSLRHEIRQLQQRVGITTIMVTHDQIEALTMADRIAVMHKGQIEQIGTPVEVYRHPTTPFVANFIGSMNFIPATAQGSDEVECCGYRLRVAATGCLTGSPLDLAIRPENVQIVEHPAGQNILQATIASHEYLGAMERFHLNLLPIGSMGDMVASLWADFPGEIARSFALSLGKQLSIYLPPESLRTFVREVG